MEEVVLVLQPGVELAVKRSHEEIWDRQTGDWLTLEDFFSTRDYGRVIEEGRVQLELELLDGSPRYVCPHCKDAMVIRSKTIRKRSVRRFYFEHGSRLGRETCGGKKGQSEKAILARKFGQNKEGVLHQAFKQWIRESLDADSEFSDTNLETRWWDVEGVRWRQPDVQSAHRGQRVAIEVQLSTTFIHVIAERMKFYRENEGRLLWLFKDLDLAEFRLSEDDIFYANNRNAFRVNPATLERSRQGKRFVLECLWLEPQLDGDDQPRRDEVFFDELIFDMKDGIPRCYWFDYGRAEAEVRAQRANLTEERKWAPLRQAFEDFYVAMLRGEMDYRERDRRWLVIRRDFGLQGIELPEYPADSDLYYPLMAAYSVKLKQEKPVGTNHPSMVPFAHYLFHDRPSAVWVFRLILLAHERAHWLLGQEAGKEGRSRSGKKKKTFKEKMADALESLADGASIYAHAPEWNRLFSVLFPEIAQLLARDPQEEARSVLTRLRSPTPSRLRARV